MRTYLLGIGLFYSAIAFTGSMGAVTTEPYNGFYLGGDIGVSNFLDEESTPYEPGLIDQHQFSATGFVGGGILGYDYSLTEQFKLALEGFVYGTALNVIAKQLYDSQPSFNANMRYNAGVRILPGYQFSPGIIGHILLGYSYGKFNIRDNGDYGYINTGVSGNGFQSGIGLKLPCYFKNLSLRGDLIYTTYGSSNSLGLTTSLTPLNYKNNFATLEGHLSLVYKFLS